MLNCYKPLNCSKCPNLGLFWFMGLGRFSECGLVNCLLRLKMDQHLDQHWITILITIWFTDHIICVCQQSLPDWESCLFVISVCLSHTMGLFIVPDVLEMCQHASRCLRCPEGLDIVPLWQIKFYIDCTHGSVYLLVMMDLIVLLSHVMAYWLCLSPSIVLSPCVVYFI